MGLPRWKRTGGRDFVFYHSHPGFEWDDLDITNAYQDTVCNDFQVSLSQQSERESRCKACECHSSPAANADRMQVSALSNQRLIRMAGGL